YISIDVYCLFAIDQNGHATITTTISQLERTPENEQLYTDIAQVFEAMLLAFQETEIIEQSVQPGNTLQVFVQAQSYNLKSGHCAVHYASIDDELKCGALKFRPKSAPNPCYDIPTDEEVSVGTNAAIVFSNEVPHRFRQIRNLTQNCKPIDLHCYSSRILAPLNIIIPILDEANQGCLLIEPILNKIIEHLGPSACKKLEDTKEFRTYVRKAMIKEESE
ncbi:unnamed protein product, partial [Rotaria sp. Silwood2]